MTNENQKEPELFKDFIEKRDENEGLGKLVQQASEDTRPGFKDKANSELQSIAYNYARDNNPELVANVEEEDFTDREQISNFISRKSVDNEQYVAGLFHKDNIDILTRQIPKGTLEKLLLVERAHADNPMLTRQMSEKDRTVYERHSNMQGLQEQMKRYEEGKFASQEEKQQYIVDAAKGLGEAEVKRLKKKVKDGELPQDKRSKDFIEAIKPIAERAVALGHVKEEDLKKYALAGAKAKLTEAKKAYEAAVEANGDNDIYTITRAGITKLAKAGTPEFAEMTKRLYTAYKIDKGKEE